MGWKRTGCGVRGWGGGGGERGVGGAHSEHRFPAPSSKELGRKPVLGVWSER